MKLNLTLLIVLLLFLNACKGKEEKPSSEKKLIGEWLIVSTYIKDSGNTIQNDNGVTIHLGCFYHAAISLNQDKTYYVNEPTGNVDGRWSLDAESKKLTLTCEGDPTIRYVFDVSLTEVDKMLWEDSYQRLVHRRIE